MDGPMTRRAERGQALVLAILLLLVLTGLGIAVSVSMTQEDRTSSRDEMQKAALYVAEAGLRRGEQVLSGFTYSNVMVNTLLGRVSTTQNPAVWPAVPRHPAPWDATHLGTYLTTVPGGGTELSRQEVPMVESRSSRGRHAFFSLYVRNNPEDTSPTANNDPRLRLVSVGWIEQAGFPVVAKIVEEEFNYEGVTQSPSAQKQGNAGGTGSALFGGD